MPIGMVLLACLPATNLVMGAEVISARRNGGAPLTFSALQDEAAKGREEFLCKQGKINCAFNQMLKGLSFGAGQWHAYSTGAAPQSFSELGAPRFADRGCVAHGTRYHPSSFGRR
jgi:hypothetical protein